MLKEEIHEAEDAGSFSPELTHGDENEEAIDPEEDRAILVCCIMPSLLPIMRKLVNKNVLVNLLNCYSISGTEADGCT